jgi:hypothetical protein
LGQDIAYASIQEAIDAAANGDTVLVDDGVYYENINFLGKAITVKSVNGAASTTIRGTGSFSVVSFWSGETASSVLDGFTITNGNATFGGGIYCESSSPTIMNCTIIGNNATTYGGGIYSDSSGGSTTSPFTFSSPTITDCIIKNNTADYYGAGIYSGSSGLSTSSPTITGCTISGNVTNTASSYGYGGGIYINYYSSPTITDCTITGNGADYGAGIVALGGGIYDTSSTPRITKCTIAGNSSSSYGGGFYINGASMEITNSIIANNNSSYGGGVFCVGPSLTTVMSCTITDNLAGTDGGGVYCEYSAPAITNSIVWGNGTVDISVGGTGSIYPVVTYSDVGGGGYSGSDGNIDADPLFVNAASGDYHLKSGSPCIDVGTDAGAPADDIDDDARPAGLVDIGADEYVAP